VRLLNVAQESAEGVVGLSWHRQAEGPNGAPPVEG